MQHSESEAVYCCRSLLNPKWVCWCQMNCSCSQLWVQPWVEPTGPIAHETLTSEKTRREMEQMQKNGRATWGWTSAWDCLCELDVKGSALLWFTWCRECGSDLVPLKTHFWTVKLRKHRKSRRNHPDSGLLCWPLRAASIVLFFDSDQFS